MTTKSAVTTLALLLMLAFVTGCDDSDPSATGAYTPAKPDPCEKAAPVNPCV